MDFLKCKTTACCVIGNLFNFSLFFSCCIQAPYEHEDILKRKIFHCFSYSVKANSTMSHWISSCHFTAENSHLFHSEQFQKDSRWLTPVFYKGCLNLLFSALQPSCYECPGIWHADKWSDGKSVVLKYKICLKYKCGSITVIIWYSQWKHFFIEASVVCVDFSHFLYWGQLYIVRKRLFLL